MNNQRNFRNNNNNRRRRNGRQGTENNEYERLISTSIPKSLMGSSPFPPQMIRKLVYYEPNLAIAPGAVSFFIRDWRMNSAYDPDPAVGGGSLVGFTQLAAIYNIYQVIRYRFRYEVTSAEANQALQFGWCMRDYQPSTTATTYAMAQDLLEQSPTTGPHMVSQIAGQPVYRSPWYKIHPAAVVGNELLYMSTAGYSAVINSNPASVVWNSFVLMADGSSGTIPNGVVLTLFMEMTVRFYSASSQLL
jgi:hypothetical protein